MHIPHIEKWLREKEDAELKVERSGIQFNAEVKSYGPNYDNVVVSGENIVIALLRLEARLASQK